MRGLRIFYTLPNIIPDSDIEMYEDYLDYAELAEDHNLDFEMISFQDSPGRFLTEAAVFDLMTGSDDSIFPITVLNGRVVKTHNLPSRQEFADWFESLDQMSFDDLLEKSKLLVHHTFPKRDQLKNFCACSSCESCPATGCALMDLDFAAFNDPDKVADWANIMEG